MTRIVYWNIEKFAINKVGNPRAKRQKGGSKSMAISSLDRQVYVLNHLYLGLGAVAWAWPDIFVVVEVSTGYDGRGQLVRGAGSDGALELLELIRDETGNDDWMLVPPIQTGPREAVAVYFDSANYAFCGPWRWPGGTGPAFDPNAAGAGVSAAYNDGDYDTTLPIGNVPVGAPNAGISQRNLAARVGYFYRAGYFPPPGPATAPIPYAGQRAPYQVTLAELGGGGAVNRLINIFAIHAPANNAANAYLSGLADVAEITDGIAANEVRVIVGDFNVNLFAANAARTQNASYTPLTVAPANYTLGITRLGAPPPVSGYDGYYATHIKRGTGATYWTTAAQTDYYPGYGVIGSTIVQNLYAIDNIYARYGGGAAGGPMNNVSIFNGVVGSPFNAAAVPVPGTAPAGFYLFRNKMGSLATFGPATITAVAAPAFSIGRRSAFKGWNNYGFIRSTSDHLAVVADI